MRLKSIKLFTPILLTIALTLPAYSRDFKFTHRADSLMKVLVSRFDSLDVYNELKQSRINKLKDSLATLAQESGSAAKVCIDLAEEYSHYISDSSLVYYKQARNIGEKTANDSLVAYSSISMAYIYAVTGYFKESSDLLDEVRPLAKGELYADFLYVKAHLYHELYNVDCPDKEYFDEYVGKYNELNNAFLAIEPRDSIRWLRCREKKALEEGDFASALYYNGKRRKSVEKNSIAESLAYYDLYYISRLNGTLWTEGLESLLVSANIDLLRANQDIASLNKLTTLMTQIGKVKYADLFSGYYYQSMVKFGSRARRLIGMDTILSANEDYRYMLEKQKFRLSLYLVMMILLTLMLAIALIVIVKLFHKLKTANERLEKAGKISNNYVAVFFKQYSLYMSRMNALRQKINMNLRRGNIDYLLDMTNPSKDIASEELKYLYHSFDEAFIDIYPDFVSDFNSMLKPEFRLSPKNGELMNSEMRVFALIKLGVKDSRQISELLHCSVKTVYNKRSGINAKLRVSKEVFEKEILHI